MHAHFANAILVSGAVINATSSGITFITSFTDSSFTRIAFAPASTAAGINFTPSTSNPFIATNKSPVFTSLESLVILGISNSKFPFAFNPSIPVKIFFNSILFSF